MRKTIYTKRHRDIAQKLRRARLLRGITQIQAARRLRKPQSYVSRCETGDHRLDVVELDTFARLYHKTLDYFTRHQPSDAPRRKDRRLKAERRP